MGLRIGFDMDGVTADFDAAFREVQLRLFGSEENVQPDRPEQEEERESSGEGDAKHDRDGKEAIESARQQRRKRDAVWQAIHSTTDFWTTLKPIEEGAVRRIHALMLRHRWEVFFITQRPATAGDTVQRQTQRWLVEQGFDLPSVLVIGGSRGAAAGALRLNYHVDDSPQNCLDVISDSRAKAILVVADNDEKTIASARKLGIGTARGIGECLDILEQASAARAEPGVLAKLAAIVGWR